MQLILYGLAIFLIVKLLIVPIVKLRKRIKYFKNLKSKGFYNNELKKIYDNLVHQRSMVYNSISLKGMICTLRQDHINDIVSDITKFITWQMDMILQLSEVLRNGHIIDHNSIKNNISLLYHKDYLDYSSGKPDNNFKSADIKLIIRDLERKAFFFMDYRHDFDFKNICIVLNQETKMPVA